MKVIYYSYVLSDGNDKKFIFDMRGILKSFATHASKEVKSAIVSEYKERVYLFHLVDDVFLFVVAKDSELIKAIDEKTMSHSDLYNKLSSSETLGFASYVVMKDCYYGMCSTFFGPKNTRFVEFVNNLLSIVGFSGISIKSHPFPVSVESCDVLKMHYRGKTSFEVSPNHNFFSTLKSYFGGSLASDDYDGIIITMKPTRGKGMPESDFKSISEAIEGDENLRKFWVRAKAETSEMVTDCYIVGTGHVCDIVKTRQDEAKIPQDIMKKERKNILLAEKVQEFRDGNTGAAKSEICTRLSDYNKSDAWTALSLDAD